VTDVTRGIVQVAPEFHASMDLSSVHEENPYPNHQGPGYWQQTPGS
jgi:hypothetical protein